MKSVLFAFGVAVCASACFAVTDDPGALHSTPGLELSFVDMYGHVNQLLDFKIVDRNNFVHTHGKILPLQLTDGQFKVFVPKAIPSGETSYRLDFWADENMNLVYDFNHDWEKSQAFSMLDHSWRVFLDDKAPRDSFTSLVHRDDSWVVGWKHHLDFVDLWEFPDRQLPRVAPNDTGIDAVVHIDNLATHAGKMGQIRVADPSGHVVCLFRFKSSAQADWKIEGCIEPNNIYDVDLYIDANGNNDANGKGYDDPANGRGSDLGWRQRKTADPTGLRVTFDAADVATGNVDVGAP